jgi:hypothetical protein
MEKHPEILWIGSTVRYRFDIPVLWEYRSQINLALLYEGGFMTERMVEFSAKAAILEEIDPDNRPPYRNILLELLLREPAADKLPKKLRERVEQQVALNSL